MKTNEWLRQQTGVQDIVCRMKKLKWQWAGHKARTTDTCWTKIVTEWIPLQGKRKQGRPATRWEDDIRKFLGVTWMRAAANREKWCIHERPSSSSGSDNGWKKRKIHLEFIPTE